MAAHLNHLQGLMMSNNTLQIPKKSLFKVNEVCGLVGVKPYVLGFWEEEFDEISPIISASGRKFYEHKDVEAVALVKKLLFEDKIPIDKAKDEIKILLSSSPNESEKDSEISSIIEDQDLEKLTMAKKSLSSLISITDSLKQKHNWG
ncbi:MAG: MerR family transcriptional regulator [Halobacteriovoraceae bacterium]|nr:MerR family transcriptional regulator [Halobacteriovoraceae bacterium]